MKPKLQKLKWKIAVGNIPLLTMCSTTIRKINNETEDMKNTINQLDLTDVYRMLHPTTTIYIFFSSAHGTFSRIDHILGHKSSLVKFKKTELVSSMFLEHNTMRLDINLQEKNL